MPFLSYFPLLVAGPIERATHLLPQIKVKRTFTHPQAISGLYQILWGLFKSSDCRLRNVCQRYFCIIPKPMAEYFGNWCFIFHIPNLRRRLFGYRFRNVPIV
jgi:hypothetical protein